MAELRLRFFGTFEASRADKLLPRPVGRKAEELLCLLLLSESAALPREWVAETLWPLTTADFARKGVRQALWQIHQAMDPSDDPSQRLIVASKDHVVVNPIREIWVDLKVFLRATGALVHLPARHLHDNQLRSLAEAAHLHRGPLLLGCYEDWCTVERDRLADTQVSALDKLSGASAHRGDYDQAIKWARQLLSSEPAHEPSHRRIMRLYSLLGDRTRALRQYERCRADLEAEFGLPPSDRTAALAMAIRRGELSDVDPELSNKAPVPIDAGGDRGR